MASDSKQTTAASKPTKAKAKKVTEEVKDEEPVITKEELNALLNKMVELEGKVAAQEAAPEQPEQKSLQIAHNKNTNLYQLHFEGGGQLPEKYTGSYTSAQLAETAIRQYEAEKLLKAS